MSRGRDDLAALLYARVASHLERTLETLSLTLLDLAL
jgi:hypothetical protein